MADDSSSSTSEESLDAKSDKFDPLKALYSEKIRLPSDNAPIYDNVCMFESRMKNLRTHSTSKKHDNTATTTTKRGEHSKEGSSSQKGKVRRTRAPGNEKNVFAKMHKMLGPLGQLYIFMEKRIRIKVYTRNQSGIRGYIEAFVLAFDKHWNLALADCLEVWKRKVKRKVPALGTPSGCSNSSSSSRPTTGSSRLITRKTEKGMETLERHVPQMLLRGQQIVLIASPS